MPQQLLTPTEAQELINTYKPQPAYFVSDILGSHPWAMQQDIIDAVFKYPAVAVKTCNAAGKSYIAARIALAFLVLNPGSIVVTTAPTWRQVSDVLWRELGAAYELSAVPISKKKPNQTSLEFAKDWFAVGLSTKDSEKFFGYHADDILVIVDEASGVEEAIYIGVDAITPNVNAHTLFIGNPTNPDGRFYQAFKDPLVKQFTISAFDTPNFTANNIANVEQLVRAFEAPEGVDPLEHITLVQKEFDTPYPALISPLAVYRRYLQWGTESPFWEALIMGQFPSQSEFSLIPINLIQQSMEITKSYEAGRKAGKLDEYTRHDGWKIPDGGLEVGVDVARYGMDRTVLQMRRGGWVDKPMAWSKQDTQATTDRVIASIQPTDPHTILRVDDTGVGGGVTDALLRRKSTRKGDEAQWHYRVTGINFGSASEEPDRFVNMRAEMFWNLREQFFAKAIALPDDPELANELGSIRFKLNSAGKIEIEKKDEIKKRTGKSPDKADALALAFASDHTGTVGMMQPVDVTEFKEPGIDYQEDIELPETAGMRTKQF